MLQLRPSTGKGQEPVRVQALCSEATVEGFRMHALSVGLPGRLKFSVTSLV